MRVPRSLPEAACVLGRALALALALALAVAVVPPSASFRASAQEPARGEAPVGKVPAAEGSESDDELLEEVVEQLLASPPLAESKQLIVDPRTGDISWYLLGNVVWEFQSGRNRVHLRCDRVVLTAPRYLARSDEEAADPSETFFYLYAEGNVRLRLPRQRSLLLAQWMLHERRVDETQLTLLHRVRLLTTVAGIRHAVSAVRLRDVRGIEGLEEGRGFDTLPLSVSAESVRTADFDHFECRGLRASTCDYEVPHFSLAGPSVEIEPVVTGEDGEDGGEDEEVRDFTLRFEGAALEVGGSRLLPLPFSYWDTRWHDYLPIRDVHLGHSSKFGLFGGVDWNVNFILEQLPLESLPPLERFVRRSRLDFETTYFGERGFGYGPKAIYGTPPREWEPWQLRLTDWEHYGESRYFAIRDHGEDRLPPRVFPDPDRFWGDVSHRQEIPYAGTVDLEYSGLSDRGFLREYFESIAKEEKEQENLVYWRRYFAGNAAATALYKYRENDFESVVERLPEGKLLLFQEPLFDTPLYTDLAIQAANLRVRPAEGSGLPARRFGRADILGEWSVPMTWGSYLDLRPFANVRYTGYEEVVDPALGSEDRFSVGAGVTASQQWSRSFDLSETVADRWLGIDRLKHVVVPKATYLNRFVNDLPPAETFGIDEVDTVALEESVALSLRQAFITRRELAETAAKPPLLGPADLRLTPLEYTTRTVLDSEASFVVFPRSGRDNGGDPLSLLVLDNTVRPGELFSLRAWAALDVNDGFRVDTTDVSATVEWVPGVLSTTVGDRFTRRPGDPRGDTNFVYGLASLHLGEKWRLQSFVSQDIEQGRNSEVTVALSRIFHRFALVFEYSVDPGEDYNQTFSVNFGPLGLIRGLRNRLLE